MDEGTSDLTLPVIEKSKSTENTNHRQRGTMAALYGDLVSEEELLESHSATHGKRHYSPKEEPLVHTASTTPDHDPEMLGEVEVLGEEKELTPPQTGTKLCPLPPESPVPSQSFGGRSRTYSVEKSQSETVSSVSQMTASLAIDVGLTKLKTVSDVSQMTVCSAINIGLAKRKSEDISNEYDIGRAGCIEALLATTVTNIALETALQKTALLTAVA